jgi:delta 1-pyrroline-5-carboxylate dehydrogenase
MIKILEQTAFLIEEKIQLACQESTIQFQKILEELQHLKILSKPKTSFQALDKLELILESLKEKNILHIHRSLQISIYQQDTIEELNICIPELHPGETFLTIGARQYSDTMKKYEFLVQKRIQWLQQIDIEKTEELEKLSKQNPQEFYNQIHRILRQRQLSQFMHQDNQRKKQSLINKIIEKIKSETIN